MLILIAIILFCSALSDFASASDWEASEYNAELRHQELLEEQRRLARRRKTPTVTRRRFIKDKHGNILAEEVTGTAPRILFRGRQKTDRRTGRHRQG